ncbi:hypothetical protein [Psychrobacillus sp. BM2]|uniref:hypothetical protein n=1 Tax=Psychrobacillus sp. BM2 TaxID=3400421 RepID=UPI003B0275A4
MKKLIFILVLFLAACGNNNEDVQTDDIDEVEYTREVYLIETANAIREIHSQHDKLIKQLAEKSSPTEVSITFMDMSILATDQSYQLPGTESLEFDLIKKDLNEIQSYVDGKYKVFSEQKELDGLNLNLSITELEKLINTLENDFKSVQ